ncbi:MAG: carboxylating nicotinate-nucleotide diphosphorylase [Verrucomicrobiota bacterium]|jgi:nicotinate-nucleotide pyrophosphorylase (carboxylating)
MAAISTHDPVSIALAEDIGSGDLTSIYFVENRAGRAKLFAKESAVAAGVETAEEVFRQVDPRITTRVVRPSGERLLAGDVVLEAAGPLPSLLTAERVALNFLQHLSGIATLTRRFVDAVEGTRAKILDTRKTVPGLRLLEKKAVLAGGGTNHRMGLYDMVMVKDNHLAAGTTQGQLQSAILRLRREHPGVGVVLEADTLSQVSSFLGLEGVDVILLDNMSPATMAEAVNLVGGRVLLEASGGVNLDTVSAIAATGVDRISIGALTHSARAIDFSMELVS